MVGANLLAVEDDFQAIPRYQGSVGLDVSPGQTVTVVPLQWIFWVRGWNGPWITDINHFPNRTHNFFQIFIIFWSFLSVLLSLLVCFFVFSAPFLCFAHSELGKNEKNRELRFLQIQNKEKRSESHVEDIFAFILNFKRVIFISKNDDSYSVIGDKDMLVTF